MFYVITKLFYWFFFLVIDYKLDDLKKQKTKEPQK